MSTQHSTSPPSLIQLVWHLSILSRVGSFLTSCASLEILDSAVCGVRDGAGH